MTITAGSFSATGTSPEIIAQSLDLSISGTFVATIAIQRRLNGTWVTMQEVTAPEEFVLDNADSLPFRLECTAYTSGFADYAYGVNRTKA